MPVAADSARALQELPAGGWRLSGWATPRVAAGVTDRRTTAAALLRALQPSAVGVEAEQAHGAGVAVIGSSPPARQVPGCDGLLTDAPGIALLIRTADCLPIFFAAPARGAVGLAHAGWRGLDAELPARMIAAFRHVYHVRAQQLAVAIGPAIRDCCYEVGPEFGGRFAPYIRERGGRRTCDLIAAAAAQLRRCGVPDTQILDLQRCTACEVRRWFSLRQEGAETGRLTSLIVLKK
jgi:YfiH family protein